MLERHENEQYFFDEKTRQHLADFLRPFQNPCCLCAPAVAETLHARGQNVALLDCDSRFANLPGYLEFDLARPRWINQKFDLILCDPPFFKVSLSQLFRAVHKLSHFDTSQALLICYLTRREKNLLRTFAPFNLQPTEYFPSYVTVQNCAKNEIAFYSNLSMLEVGRDI